MDNSQFYIYKPQYLEELTVRDRNGNRTCKYTKKTMDRVYKALRESGDGWLRNATESSLFAIAERVTSQARVHTINDLVAVCKRIHAYKPQHYADTIEQWDTNHCVSGYIGIGIICINVPFMNKDNEFVCEYRQIDMPIDSYRYSDTIHHKINQIPV